MRTPFVINGREQFGQVGHVDEGPTGKLGER